MIDRFSPDTVILNTRASHQAADLSSELRMRGAKVLEIPALEIELLPIEDEIAREIARLGPEDFLALTSSNAVQALCYLGTDALNGLRRARVVVVGDATAAAISELEVVPHIVSKIQTARGLGEELSRVIGSSTPSVLFLKGDCAGRDLERELSSTKAQLKEFVVYRSREASDLRQRLSENLTLLSRVTGCCFMSGNAARAFVSALSDQEKKRLLQLPTAVPGPNTAQVLIDLGFVKTAVSRSPSVSDVVSTLVQVIG